MIDARLSSEIEAGAKMIPMFSTEIITTDGGWEVRNSRHAYPRFKFEFNLMPGVTDDFVVEEFVDLFIAAGGSFETFLFTPWRDYQADDQALTELTATTFQMFKSYTRGSTTRQQKITRPVAGTEIIRRNGSVMGSGYTIDNDTGIVTFSASQTGQAITADFDFDLPVRFMDDELEILAHTGELNQAIDVMLIQVKE